MKKKSLLVASCLVVVGLFIGTKTADAEESVTRPTTRATIVRHQLTLRPLESRIFYLESANQTKFATKVIFKIKPNNKNNDYYNLEHYGSYRNEIFQRKDLMLNDDKEITLKWSPANDDALKDVITKGRENFLITNYSPVTMYYNIAYTSGLHFKTNGCVDYSDIDFNLE
ncbi:hypothetical protein ACWOC1_05330 [Enterococcus quebecensis]|uniref:DUF5067 domain-containing protein n=1 Tax=Enterococcus quebecensis TaxID=903983 RepID=A0A1E5GUA7_9ENTE|nr:hypothetical protein [Enterococcus quebecensis]OEG16274.1 hypothetical protein BCR23_05135 [Enterococcus quebecensis]OJG74452.1 hypothetical protein RV12_GL002509 [Enterococcus quebecensis]